jgi:hypothetical protein
VTYNELVRKLRNASIDAELWDLIGAFDFDLAIEESEQTIDEELKNLSKRSVARLTNDDLTAITGFDSEELARLNNARHTRPVKKLSTCLDLAKREGLQKDEAIAFRYLEKNFIKTQNLTATMNQAMEMFDDCLSPDERSLLDKAAKALDLSLFIQLLSGVMKRAAA